MGTLSFKPASKSAARLRLALFGPSGSGKTFTALRLAEGLGGKVAVIDTERGSASKYADRFRFDVLELPSFGIDVYVEAIRAAAGYDVLIIDSLTHAWHQLLDDVEKLARAKFAGNTWSAWSQGTPKQRGLVDALLAFDGHVIATMRTKTEWSTATDERTGKSKPVRVGLAPEQGKGIEYEFDLLGELSPDHVLTIIKDRTGRYQDATLEKPGEQLGRDLAAWLAQGKAPERQPEPAAAEVAAETAEPAKPAVQEGLVGFFGPRAEAPKKAGNGDGKPRMATVKTGQWFAAADALAEAEPHFENADEKARRCHMAACALKIGFTAITDENLAQVLDALRTYAHDAERAKAAPEEVQDAA